MHKEAQELREAGKHKVFFLKGKGHWLCVCGDLYVESKDEAELHQSYPHLTEFPEDWEPQEEY